MTISTLPLPPSFQSTTPPLLFYFFAHIFHSPTLLLMGATAVVRFLPWPFFRPTNFFRPNFRKQRSNLSVFYLSFYSHRRYRHRKLFSSFNGLLWNSSTLCWRVQLRSHDNYFLFRFFFFVFFVSLFSFLQFFTQCNSPGTTTWNCP